MGRRRTKKSGEGSSAATAIPPEAMEMVERIKEVVDRSDHEIYAVLVEYNMDPDEAINCLMFQDTFIEVKSKRKKGKETKETHESGSKLESSSSSSGFTGDIHDGGPSISIQLSSCDYGVMHGKLVQEKDDGINTTSTSSILSSGMAANDSSPRLTSQRLVLQNVPETSLSESDSINTSQSTGLVDYFSFSSRPPLSSQPIWSRAPARPTVVDTVRTDRSQGKASSTPIAATGPVDNFSFFSPFSFHPNWSGAAACPTLADIFRIGEHPGKASSTPVMATGPTDSMNTSLSIGPLDNFSFFSRQPFSFQPNCPRPPARPTMADVVRMGRLQKKASSTTIVATDGSQSKSCDAFGWKESHSNPMLYQNTVLPVGLNLESHSSYDHVSNVTEIYRGPGGGAIQQQSHDEWSLADQPSVRIGQIVCEIFDASVNYADEAALSSSHAYDVDSSLLNDDQVLDGNIGDQNLPTESIKSASASDRQVDNSGYGFPHVEGNHEAEHACMELSLATSILRQLSLHEEHDTAPAESCPGVIIPEHMQVTSADCSLVTFGSGISATGVFIPRPRKSNLEVASVTDTNVPPVGQPDTRISKYHFDEKTGPFLDDSVSFRTVTSTDDYGTLSTSQPEVIRNDTFVALHASQQNFPCASGYAFSNTTQPTAAAYTYGQANSHMQNLSSFSSAMAVRPVVPNRLVPNQSSYQAYQRGHGIARVWDPVRRWRTFTLRMPNSSISFGSFHTQHHTLPSYSQPTCPSGHYLPSAAIQQAYSGSNAFQLSPTMLHRAGTRFPIPQARGGISLNNFVPLADVAFGRGGSGNSANIPGSYRETLGLQFIGANRFLPPPHGENAPTGDHGASTRTATALPGGTSFSFQGWNQHGRDRECPQPSHLETSGRSGNHGCQAVFSEEHRQHLGQGNFDASWGPLSHKSDQIWRQRY